MKKKDESPRRYYRPEHKNTVDDATIWISQMLGAEGKALYLYWFKSWMITGKRPYDTLLMYCPRDVEEYEVWINGPEFEKIYQRIKKCMPDEDEM